MASIDSWLRPQKDRHGVLVLMSFCLIISACGSGGTGGEVAADSDTTAAGAAAPTEAPQTTPGSEPATTEVSQTPPGSESATSESEPQELRQVQFRTDWIPDGKAAPFWLALERGYFEEEGLAVEILDGTGSSVSIQQVTKDRKSVV